MDTETGPTAITPSASSSRTSQPKRLHRVARRGSVAVKTRPKLIGLQKFRFWEGMERKARAARAAARQAKMGPDAEAAADFGATKANRFLRFRKVKKVTAQRYHKCCQQFTNWCRAKNLTLKSRGKMTGPWRSI